MSGIHSQTFSQFVVFQAFVLGSLANHLGLKVFVGTETKRLRALLGSFQWLVAVNPDHSPSPIFQKDLEIVMVVFTNISSIHLKAVVKKSLLF